MEKHLGKIERIHFGFGGYQNAEFGLWLTFSGKAWGVCHGLSGGWSSPPSKHAVWTLEHQSEKFAEMSREIIALLNDAKVSHVGQLEGIPVECIFDGTNFRSFRILKEVL